MDSANGNPAPRAVRFAAFDLNPRARELTKNGRRIRLPGLPFEVLAVLIERPGEVVTRDELYRRLWPDGTFVDFDNNLNAAVARLRQALGDSAERPQFIETLPRVGYRFIAPLDKPDEHPRTPDPAAAVLGPAPGEPARVPRSLLPSRRTALWIASAALLGMLGGIGIGAQWLMGNRPSSESDLAVQRGSELLRQRDAKGAVNEFQRAIRLDPNNAHAYSSLAQALNRVSDQASVARVPGRSPSVEAAERGVALDPNCGRCQGTLGFFLLYHDWQWARAEQHLQTAIRLAPEDEAIRPSYAHLLIATGRLDDALREIDFALARQPYEVGWHGIRASILYCARRFPEAIAATDRALAIDNRDRSTLEWRSKTLFQMGRSEEAIKTLAQVAFAQHGIELEAAVHHAGGAGGLKKLLEITGDWQTREELSWRRGPWRLLLNDIDGALDELEKAYALRNYHMMYLKVDPVYDIVRSHPRFAAILKGVGL